MPTDFGTLFPLFIIVLSLLFLVVLFIIFYPLIKKSYFKKHFDNVYGRQIYKLSNKQDYYLINRLALESDDKVTHVDIDHLLCGDKYIYVITDAYFDGALNAKANDRSWIYYERKNRKEYYKRKIENQIFVSESKTKRLMEITNLDSSLLISILLVNNNCQINEDFVLNKDNSFLIPIGKLNKLIHNLEKRNVGNINQVELKNAVNDIAHLNLNRKHGK